MLRLLMISALVLTTAAAAKADDAPHHVGLKSEDVIANDLRQLNLRASRIEMEGPFARVTTTIDGRTETLRIDRVTGHIERMQGALLRPGLLLERAQPPVIRRDLRIRID